MLPKDAVLSLCLSHSGYVPNSRPSVHTPYPSIQQTRSSAQKDPVSGLKKSRYISFQTHTGTENSRFENLERENLK